MSTSEPTDTLGPTGTRPRYEEYEDSGVSWIGEIPAHWRSAKVRYLCNVRRGASPRPIDDSRYFDEEGRYSWVRISDITASDQYLKETEQTLSEEGESESVPVEPGGVLISIAATVGKPIITDIKCCIHDGFVHLNNLEGESTYFYYVFCGGEIYKGIGKEGTQLNLNTDSVGNLEVPVPPVDEQRAIAEYLDRETERIDALIEKKEQLIDLLEEKRTALISRVVTQGLDRDVEMQDSGVQGLGEIPVGWDTVALKYVARFINGATFDASDWESNGVPIIRISNLNDDPDFNYLPRDKDVDEKYHVREGDLLFGWSGNRGTSFGPHIWSEKGLHYLNQHIFKVENYSLDTDYLYWVLEAVTYFIEQRARGTIHMVHVTKSDLGNTQIPVVSESKQQAIAGYLNRETGKIDRLIERVNRGIGKLKEYRTALISAAVTGQIDVREEARTPDVKEAGTWERMILTVELIRRMRSAQHQSLGRTLLVKMLYLIQHHVRVTGMGFNYKRKDYGPYASELRYKVENALQNQGWIQVSEDGMKVQYELLEKADDETVQAYFESSWGDVKDQIDEIVSCFHQFDAEQAEIVATLYAAWNDLKILGRPHDEEAIIREVRENWHPRKREIDESRWQKALHWMEDEGLVPIGFGEPTIEEEG